MKWGNGQQNSGQKGWHTEALAALVAPLSLQQAGQQVFGRALNDETMLRFLQRGLKQADVLDAQQRAARLAACVRDDTPFDRRKSMEATREKNREATAKRAAAVAELARFDLAFPQAAHTVKNGGVATMQELRAQLGRGEAPATGAAAARHAGKRAAPAQPAPAVGAGAAQPAAKKLRIQIKPAPKPTAGTRRSGRLAATAGAVVPQEQPHADSLEDDGEETDGESDELVSDEPESDSADRDELTSDIAGKLVSRSQVLNQLSCASLAHAATLRYADMDEREYTHVPEALQEQEPFAGLALDASAALDRSDYLLRLLLSDPPAFDDFALCEQLPKPTAPEPLYQPCTLALQAPRRDADLSDLCHSDNEEMCGGYGLLDAAPHDLPGYLRYGSWLAPSGCD